MDKGESEAGKKVAAMIRQGKLGPVIGEGFCHDEAVAAVLKAIGCSAAEIALGCKRVKPLTGTWTR